MEERYFWIGLNCVSGIGSITAQRLLEAFGSPRRIFRASAEELMEVEGVGEKLARRIEGFPLEEVLEREIAAVEKEGLTVLTLHDEDYPEALRSLYDPPPVLYIRGTLLASDFLSIAVVGTRTPTAYGRAMTERLAGELASLGFTIVSGLARGIDGLAHEVALRSGGRTLAVCGHGLDRVFPPEHEGLARAIAEQGALVSEFPLSTPPFRQNFPRRNRIISGLALGCVVVEASGDSGSLITARCALEQGREVFAVPGLATTGKSRGAHRLIQQGATLVESADDILEALPLHIRRLIKQQEPRWEEGMAGESFALEEAFQRVSAEERALLTLIRQEPYPIDRLIEESGLSPSTVSGLLVQLELRGLVQRGCDGRFGLSQAAWS